MTLRSTYDPGALGLDVVGRLSHDEYRVRCPYHDDTRPSAQYNVLKDLFYCFGCHEVKTSEELARDLDGRLVPMGTEMRRKLRELGGDRAWMSLLMNPVAIGNDYLHSRLVPDTQIARFDIRHFDDGVVFPIHDKMGQLTGVQIRHYEREPKYLIHGERQPVWNIRRLMTSDYVFVTEGVFGVLRADRCAIPAVSIMGSGSVKDAAQVLRGFGRRAFAVMDPDFAGRLAAGKFILHGIPALVGHKKPPDEWNSHEWVMVFENAKDMTTLDVMDVVDEEPWNLKLESRLKKYWRKHVR